MDEADLPDEQHNLHHRSEGGSYRMDTDNLERNKDFFGTDKLPNPQIVGELQRQAQDLIALNEKTVTREEGSDLMAQRQEACQKFSTTLMENLLEWQQFVIDNPRLFVTLWRNQPTLLFLLKDCFGKSQFEEYLETLSHQDNLKAKKYINQSNGQENKNSPTAQSIPPLRIIRGEKEAYHIQEELPSSSQKIRQSQEKEILTKDPKNAVSVQSRDDRRRPSPVVPTDPYEEDEQQVMAKSRVTRMQMEEFRQMKAAFQRHIELPTTPVLDTNLLDLYDEKEIQWPIVSDIFSITGYLLNASSLDELVHLCYLLVAHNSAYQMALQSILNETYFNSIISQVKQLITEEKQSLWLDQALQSPEFRSSAAQSHPRLSEAIGLTIRRRVAIKKTRFFSDDPNFLKLQKDIRLALETASQSRRLPLHLLESNAAPTYVTEAIRRPLECEERQSISQTRRYSHIPLRKTMETATFSFTENERPSDCQPYLTNRPSQPQKYQQPVDLPISFAGPFSQPTSWSNSNTQMVIPSPTTFTGHGMMEDKIDFHSWLKKFEMSATLQNWTEQQRVLMIGQYLQGRAFEIYQDFHFTATSTWEDLKVHLTEALQERRELQDVIYECLGKRPFTVHEKPSQYLNAMMRQIRQTGHFSADVDKIIAPMLLHRMPAELQVQIRTALQFEARIRRCQESELSFETFVKEADKAYDVLKRSDVKIFQKVAFTLGALQKETGISQDQRFDNSTDNETEKRNVPVMPNHDGNQQALRKENRGEDFYISNGCGIRNQRTPSPSGYSMKHRYQGDQQQNGFHSTSENQRRNEFNNNQQRWNTNSQRDFSQDYVQSPERWNSSYRSENLSGANRQRNDTHYGQQGRNDRNSYNQPQQRNQWQDPNRRQQQDYNNQKREFSEAELRRRRLMNIPDYYHGPINEFDPQNRRDSFKNSSERLNEVCSHSKETSVKTVAQLTSAKSPLVAVEDPIYPYVSYPEVTMAKTQGWSEGNNEISRRPYDHQTDPFPLQVDIEDLLQPFARTYNFNRDELDVWENLRNTTDYTKKYPTILAECVYEMGRAQASLEGVPFLREECVHLQPPWIPQVLAWSIKRAAEIVFSVAIMSDPEYQNGHTCLRHYVNKYTLEIPKWIRRFEFSEGFNEKVARKLLASHYPGVTVADLHKEVQYANVCQRLHAAVMTDIVHAVSGSSNQQAFDLGLSWEKWLPTPRVAVLTNETNALRAIAIWDGRIEVVTSIDTGSPHSLIRADLYYNHLCHLQLRKTRVRLACYNDQQLNLIGAVSIPVRMGEAITVTNCQVCEGGPYAALLGMDWLQQVGHVRIDTMAHVIKIGNFKPYPLYPPKIVSRWEVTLVETVDIPPRSKMIVEVRLPLEFPLGSLINLEMNSILYRNFKILMPNSLHQPDSHTVLTELLNPLECHRQLQQGTKLGVACLTANEVENDRPESYIGLLQTQTEEDMALPPGVSVNDGNMDENQQEQMANLIRRYRNIFARNDYDVGSCEVVKVKIDTGKSPPFKLPNYRTPECDKKVAQECVTDMLGAGIIERSHSPYSSPINIVRKKNGKPRFTRRLNTVTKNDVYPLPRIDATLDRLEKRAWLTTMDLNSGFFNIVIDEESREKTAFRVEAGLYHFVKLPMGLSISPAACQRTMEVLLADLNWDTCLVYLDDIIVPSETFEEHLESLEKVFQALQAGNMKLKGEKCHFACKQLLFLGHTISPEGIKVNPEKLDAVKRFPQPINVRMLRRFIGLANHYRRHIPKFSEIIHPFLELLKKEKTWIWTKDCKRAFIMLKAFLLSDLIVTLPDFTKPFYLHVDTSGYAIGAALMQKDEKGLDRVISYNSFTLDEHQRNYSITKREFYGVYRTMRYFRPYLLQHETVVVTDHKPLVTLRENQHANCDSIMMSWVTNLEEFNYVIEYRRGQDHYVPDSLSRYLPTGPDPYIPSVTEMENWLLTDHPETKLDDAGAQEYLKKLKRLKLTRKTPQKNPKPENRMKLRQRFRDEEEFGLSTENFADQQQNRKLQLLLSVKDRPEPTAKQPLPIAVRRNTSSSGEPPPYEARLYTDDNFPIHLARDLPDRENPYEIGNDGLKSWSTVDFSYLDWSGPITSTSSEASEVCNSKPICVVTQPEGNLDVIDICGICNETEDQSESTQVSWIQCDKCDGLFHQTCAKVNPTETDRREELNVFYCPSCADLVTTITPDQAKLKTEKDRSDIWSQMTSTNMMEKQDADEECRLMKTYLKAGTLPAALASELASSYERAARNYVLKEDILYRIVQNNRPGQFYQVIRVICVPVSLRKTALQLCHEDPVFGGHMGTQKTYGKAISIFDWPSMRKDVQNFCYYCLKCQCRKLSSHKRHAPMTPIEAKLPGEKWAADFSGPFPTTSRGNCYILTFIDMFTNYVECFPTKDQTAETVADIFIKEIVTRYGVPRYLLTDQGTQFVSSLFRNICSLVGTTKVCCAAYHPQTNGKVERHHRTLNTMLSLYINPDRNDWDQYVPFIKSAYCNAIHASTGYTPHELMFGRPARTPVSNMHSLQGTTATDIGDYVYRTKCGMEETYKLVRGQMENVQTEMKKRYDQQAGLYPLEVGDLVLVQSPIVSRGQTRKFSSEGKGPFVVTSVYLPANYDVARLEPERRKKNYLKKVARDRLHILRISPEDQQTYQRLVINVLPQHQCAMSTQGKPLQIDEDPDETEHFSNAIAGNNSQEISSGSNPRDIVVRSGKTETQQETQNLPRTFSQLQGDFGLMPSKVLHQLIVEQQQQRELERTSQTQSKPRSFGTNLVWNSFFPRSAKAISLGLRSDLKRNPRFTEVE